MVELSHAERQAELIYYAAVSRRYTFKEAVLAAMLLERESSLGAAYLRWLLARGGTCGRPSVEGAPKFERRE